jgi:hypothetical protein
MGEFFRGLGTKLCAFGTESLALNYLSGAVLMTGSEDLLLQTLREVSDHSKSFIIDSKTVRFETFPVRRLY